MTQPAISLQIKALEKELGEALFERMRKQIRLTPAGEILYHRVREVFGSLRAARDEIGSLQNILRGHLVVGTSDTHCTYILPEVLRRFHACYPQVEIDVRNRMSLEIGRLVLDNEVDIGLATLPVRHRDLVGEELFARREVLICRPGHPLDGRQCVRLRQVAEYPLLALERGSVSRRLLEEAFRREELALQPAMNLGSIEVIKRFVEVGMGVAVVPRIAVEAEVAAGRLALAKVRGLEARPIGLVEHRGRKRSPAAGVFVELLKERVAQLDP